MNIVDYMSGKVNGVLETFDRMIINGYILQLCSSRQFQFYLTQSNVLLKDFSKFATRQTDSLCANIENYIKVNGVALQYLDKASTDKGELAKKKLSSSPGTVGLIAAFSVVENCKTTTVTPNGGTKRLEIIYRAAKCKHYYLYYNDSQFGFMFLRIQTWFPYTVQIYINGREFLSKLMDKSGIKYTKRDNSFAFIEDYGKAQELADNVLKEKLSDSFDGMVVKINNLLPGIKKAINRSYYWCIDQCEFATDIGFKDRQELESIYKTLVETTFFTFSSHDIYTFFGRRLDKIHAFTQGEITSDLRRRQQGYRVKFKINNNQIKMYDKGNNLRIEVTINNPKEFKILKVNEVAEDGKLVEKKKWIPMGKSIANLYRYVEISRNIISRYIKALPEIDADKLPLKELKNISCRKEVGDRSYSAINIFNEETLKLFAIIASGEYLIKGFDNKALRKRVFSNGDSDYCVNKTTRLLSKLRVHGVIKKTPRKNRYYLTDNGRKIIGSVLLYANKSLLNTV